MSFTFVDLFAGIGGFHAALSAMGGRCVYAVEVDKAAAQIYKNNWGLDPLGDITEDVSDTQVLVPRHDVLVAGFPCQPFSKSGAQRGMDETRGTLYWRILRIVQKRKPSLIILENVRNLAGPRHAHEWKIIVETLRDEGYLVSDSPGIYSPHLLPPRHGGRPQVRERVFIVAIRNPKRYKVDQQLLAPVVDNRPLSGWDPMTWDLEKHLLLSDPDKSEGSMLTKSEMHWINAWDEFVMGMYEIRDGRRLPGFPLWGDNWVLTNRLRIPRGTPTWKVDYLRKNAEFYTEHQNFIDTWVNRWDFYSEKFPPSRRKLEWQAQDTPRLWDTVMHFRPSGIRAKRATYLPALVAITQTSIIGPRKRRLSVREAARLQGLPDWFEFGNQPDSTSYRQLGNGVSVGVVWHVIKQTVKQYDNILSKTCPGLVAAARKSTLSPDAPLRKMRRNQAH